MSERFITNTAIWDRVEKTLMKQLGMARKAIGHESIGVSIAYSPESDLARFLSSADHLDWWCSGFRVPRQSGATRWISSKLDPFTMILVDNPTTRQTLLDSATKPHQLMPGFNVHPPTTSFSEEELKGQVVNWTIPPDLLLGDAFDAFIERITTPEITAALQRVTRIIPFMMNPDRRYLEAISGWSRRGGKVPEILVIN